MFIEGGVPGRFGGERSRFMALFSSLASIAAFVLALASAGHALLLKRDPRAALGWIALCVLIPFGGPLLYFLFGINRVKTKAKKLRPDDRKTVPPFPERNDASELARSLIRAGEGLAEFINTTAAVTKRPLVAGNRIDFYHNGEGVYPAMIETIESASRTLFLTTYIFETNRTGRRFIAALGDAVRRGVDVRVILDGVGEFYSCPRAGTLLKRAGVPVGRFIPPRLFVIPSIHINLRNHRKLMVADGAVGFTGGMNIGDRHLVNNLDNPNRVVDMHFRISGPVAAALEEVFLDDWAFVTGRYEPGSGIQSEPAGDAVCRVITDGPNEDLDKLAMVLIGAVTAARRSVTIMTPYFIPPRELMAVLQAASLRGIRVLIVLPEKNNLPPVHWAARNMLWELLRWDVEVYYQPPPFVHTKLFMIDDHYLHIGSANIDPRSLRLNFELAVEVYDEALAGRLAEHVEQVRRRSRRVTLEEVDARPFPERVRDSLAWLLSPYM